MDTKGFFQEELTKKGGQTKWTRKKKVPTSAINGSIGGVFFSLVFLVYNVLLEKLTPYSLLFFDYLVPMKSLTCR